MLGALLGYGLTRSTWGAVIGAIIAYLIHQGSRTAPASSAGPQELRAGFFRAAFEDHPPYQELLAAIPTSLMLCAEPGLIGCAALAGQIFAEPRAVRSSLAR